MSLQVERLFFAINAPMSGTGMTIMDLTVPDVKPKSQRL